jgi:hypothetical protein
MKFQSVIAISAALVATSFAMDQPSFHTKGTPTGKPTKAKKMAPGIASLEPNGTSIERSGAKSGGVSI